MRTLSSTNLESAFGALNIIIYNLSVRVGKQIMRIKSDKQIIEMKLGEVISDLNPGRGRGTLTDHDIMSCRD